MCGKHLQAFPRLDIPNSDGLIEGTGGKHVGLGIEIDRENVVGVASKGFDEGASGDVPETDGAVVGGGGEETSVGGEGQVGDAQFVAMEFVVDSIGRGQGVSAGGFVGGAGREEAAILGELNAGDGPFVAGKGVLEAIGFEGFSRLRR